MNKRILKVGFAALTAAALTLGITGCAPERS